MKRRLEVSIKYDSSRSRTRIGINAGRPVRILFVPFAGGNNAVIASRASTLGSAIIQASCPGAVPAEYTSCLPGPRTWRRVTTRRRIQDLSYHCEA